VHYPGAISHFIARGNDRQEIFRDDRDRKSFERFLKDGVQRFNHRIHVFCWMTNHVHMAVQVSDVPLAKIAHNLLFRYARWFNWRHGRTGHLFERRYRSYAVRTDAALQSLARYIHLNPVQAGIVERPHEYPWSSYSAYLGRLRPPPSWLTTDSLLSLFADTRSRAIAALVSFTESQEEERGGGDEDPKSLSWDAASELTESHSNLEEHHLEAASRYARSTLEEILNAVSASTAISRADLALDTQRRSIVRARAAAAWLVSRAEHVTLEELGEVVRRDASTLSRAATTFARRRSSDTDTRALCRALEAALGLEPR
jgi:REP element-mobilizing transposase RayT